MELYPLYQLRLSLFGLGFKSSRVGAGLQTEFPCLLQDTLIELEEFHKNRQRQKRAASIQQAWRAHRSRKLHAHFRDNTATQVTLAQARLVQEWSKQQVPNLST